MTAVEAQKTPNLKSIALPTEHGGWGFLLEPIILGLIGAFSAAAILFSLGMVAVFLIHQPIKIVAKDSLKRRSTERTHWAKRFVLLYGGLASVVFAFLISQYSAAFLLPFVFSLPLMLLQFGYDAQNKSRELIPEISGALALGAIAPSIAILKDWELSAALGLWLVMALRVIPAILYVRARLRLERGNPAPIGVTNSVHGFALAISMPLAIFGSFPPVVPFTLGLLMLRSLWGLSSYRMPASRPAVIGIQEMILGLLFAICVGIGYTKL